MLQGCLHTAFLGQVGQPLGFRHGIKFLSVALYLFKILLVRAELSTEVKIMQEGVAFGTYVHEAGIESGHQLTHLAQIDVAYRVAGLLALLVLVFHQILVLEQGY